MNKRGAMTVPKLVAILLAIVVLVFLIFGARQLKPLYERIGIMFDSVLYYFGIGDDGGGGGESCREVTVEGVGNGDFCISQSECKIDLKIEKLIYTFLIQWPGANSFRFVEDNLEYWIPPSDQGKGFWGDIHELNYFRVDVKTAKKEREIYKTFYSSVSHGDWLVAGRAPGVFRGLWFKVEDWGKPTIYRRSLDGWYSGTSGENILKKDWEDSLALEEIYKNSRWTSPVYWKFYNDAQAEEQLLKGMKGDEGQIDSKEDYETFKRFFYIKRNELNAEYAKKEGSAAEKIVGKKVSILGETCEIKKDNFGGKLIFFVEGEFGKYGLVNSDTENAVYLFQFVSGSWSKSATPQSFLEETDDSRVETIIKLSQIYLFLREKCR